MKSNRVALLLLACVVIMYGARLLGPSALQRQDQPRTVSYTADIAANGRWLLPRDMFGEAATKPPLVNWLAVPLLKLGFWTEWAVKMPMLLGSLATVALTVWAARRLLRDNDAAFLAGIAWLVNPANVSMIYHCRPDPVLNVFVTAAWLLGTVIISEKRAARAAVVAFWVCVGLAGLTKGPAALVPVIYVIVAARVIAGRWSFVQRTQWWWGLPLAAALFLAWAVPCALRHADAFYEVLVRQQLLAHIFGLGPQLGNEHITGEGPIAALRLIWQNPLWFVQRFLPWSLAAVGALVVIGWRRWFRHELAPAILWLGTVLIFFALSAHKTADYIQPAFPAAAVLAAWFCMNILPRPRSVAWGGLLLAIGLAVDFCFFSASAKDHRGENLKAFAREVRTITRGERVVFAHTGYNTLQFFLGANQASDAPSQAQLAAARWAILPVLPDVPAAATSQPVPASARRSVVLGLYPIDAVRSAVVPSPP
jgi:4-amino-4-deoxy-L-arabinose transferase-like glycosyltransferase